MKASELLEKLFALYKDNPNADVVVEVENYCEQKCYLTLHSVAQHDLDLKIVLNEYIAFTPDDRD